MTRASNCIRPVQLVCAYCLVLLLSTLNAWAHGPFDNSTRLYVLDDHLELALTVGMDGARQILSVAGVSPEESAKLLAVSGPGSFRDAPIALATRLFEIKAGAETLNARKLKVFTDGLEANFALEYPRATNASLAVEARYFNGVEPLLAGALTVTDENGNILDRAVLSRASAAARVAIARVAGSNGIESVAVASTASTASNEPIHVTVASGSSVRPEQSSAPLLVWCAVGLAILLTAWFVGKRFFKR
ncbi:MAG: hypothetical protein EPO07_15090 [Verrucomicrobia bacterium]|nr:MAG: hypothetical protein EPO07_15090 [Verrucomicrobiota bacterium]